MVKNTGSHLCFQHTYVPTSTYHTQPGLNSKKGQVELLAVLQSQTELNFAGMPAVNNFGTYMYRCSQQLLSNARTEFQVMLVAMFAMSQFITSLAVNHLFQITQ